MRRHFTRGTYQLWLVPALLVMMLCPWSPPPAKHAHAQLPPIIKPADPFDNIVITDPRRIPRVKPRTVAGIPLVLGIGDLK